ncbi:MAG: NHL repeat-containing protein [Bacteroidota bacterium]|nr:NHL repeat-containing protein [Bacteroidota bacterium]
MLLIFFVFSFNANPQQHQNYTVESTLDGLAAGTSFFVGYQNSIFIVEQRSHSVSSYSFNFHLTKFLGGQGWGNYEFDTPTDVWSSFLLEVYVTDFNNRRIQKYDKDLNFIQTFDENSIAHLEGRFYPRACATSSQGDLFVVESDGKRILKIDRRNQFEKEIGTFKDGEGALTNPTDIAISTSDEIFVLDQTTIKVFDLFGNYLRTISVGGRERWRNIQVYKNGVIATSAHAVTLFSSDGSLQLTIPASSIIGMNQQEELQDAYITSDSFYVLTTTTLYRCSMPQ